MELHKHVFIIVGLHLVLKTTVVHKLCKMIPCASALNEVVCDVPFCAKMDDDQTIRTIKWICYEYIHRVLEMLFTNRDAESHIVICDRLEYYCLVYYVKGKCKKLLKIFVEKNISL